MNSTPRLVVFLSSLVWLPAASAADKIQLDVSIDRMDATYVVQPDGSFEKVAENSIRLNTEWGAKEMGQRSISYNNTLDRVDVLEAYTLQPDGTKIPVAANAIRIVDDAVSGSDPIFSDTKRKVIIFPRLKVGSRMYYKYRQTRHTPIFPGHFFMRAVYSPQLQRGKSETELFISDAVKLNIDSKGVDGGLVSTMNGMRHYRYTFKQENALRDEPGMPDPSDFAPYIRASTFEGHAALGRAYEERARPMAAVTPSIQKLADELTRGLSDRREQARVLYHWVSAKIRYVGIHLGAGGWVPHDAASVLANRYGDCKDHVVLLESLLAAKGIGSSPALINSGNAFRLPSVATGEPFNHVITYIPSLDLYLDSTAQFAPFGTLPGGLMDKPVVLTALGRIGQTPKLLAEKNAARTTVRLSMRGDGSVQGSSVITFSGPQEIISRRTEFDEDEGRSEDRVRQALGTQKEYGSGTVRKSDPNDLNKPFEIRATFTLDSIADIPGPGTFSIPTGYAPGHIATLTQVDPSTERLFPKTCAPVTYLETYTLDLPAAVKVTRLPKGVDYTDGQQAYTARYQRKGQAISMTREYTRRCPGRVLNNFDPKSEREIAAVMRRDLRAQVVYE